MNQASGVRHMSDEPSAASSDHGALVARARAALDEIIDPCSSAAGLPAGLVTLGLVKAIDLQHDSVDGPLLVATLRVTGPGCVMAPVFVEEAQRRLAAVAGRGKAIVRFDATPDWEQSDMDPAYRERRRLALAQASRFVPPAPGANPQVKPGETA